MTTNKPDVVAWLNETWLSATQCRQAVHDWEDDDLVVTPLVRLSDYEALQAECEELRKDAERYRWLRADNAYFPEENYIRGGQELDAAIDAAMAGGDQ